MRPLRKIQTGQQWNKSGHDGRGRSGGGRRSRHGFRSTTAGMIRDAAAAGGEQAQPPGRRSGACVAESPKQVRESGGLPNRDHDARCRPHPGGGPLRKCHEMSCSVMGRSAVPDAPPPEERSPRAHNARPAARARPPARGGRAVPLPWMSCFVMRRPCDVMKCHVRSCARPCAKRGSRREGARRLRCRSTGEEAATGRGCRDTGPAPARRGWVPERPGRGGPGRSRHSGCNASRSVPGSERPCALSSRPAASSFDGLRPAGPCPNRTRAMWQ